MKVVHSKILPEGLEMKVAMVLQEHLWLGGRNYLRNLLTAVDNSPSVQIEPVLFTGRNSEAKLFAEFPPVRVVRSRMLDDRSVAWTFRKLIVLFTSRDKLFERLLKSNGVDVLSHSGHLGSASSISTIGWVPDFQFMSLGDIHSRKQLRGKARRTMELCERCDTIVLSSEAAKEDMRAFAPQYMNKVEVLRFIANPAPVEGLRPFEAVRSQYKIVGSYFLLPNQWWIHKNHKVVIDALSLAKRFRPDLLVLATGATDDERNPKYFPSLMQLAADFNILDSLRVLGVIPYQDLATLMRHAVAIINPSIFEGWSTSVEEAKSAGKEILLSDIPVHREQAPARGFYFPPDDPERLATLLCESLDRYDALDDERLQSSARSKFHARQLAFAEEYQAIVIKTIGRHRQT